MASGSILLLPLLIFVIEQQTAMGCDNATSLSIQVDLMLAEYDRSVLPGAPVQVQAALDVQHATIDERAATVRLLAALYLNWEDKRLAWNASSWGCESTLVSAERLWLPDVGVLSAAVAGGVGGDLSLRAKLTSDGRVSWVLRLDLISPINLALDAWPQDVHEIIYKFGSRTYSSDELNLTLSDMEHATIFESGTWELMSVRNAEVTSWKRLDVEQQLLMWKVTLQRRAPAQALATRAVLFTCVALLVAASCLPPASRPALCATAALTGALWLIAALARLPGASSAPRVMSLVCAVSACGAAAAAGAALVLRAARCSAPPPHALRSLVTATSAFCKLAPPEGSGAERSAWAAAAQLLDYVLLAALLLTLFVLVCLAF